MMVHVMQPSHSKLCGQACVATIAGLSLDQALKICTRQPSGHATLAEQGAPTTEHHLRAGLKACGFVLDPFERWDRTGGVLPRPDDIALLRVKTIGSKGGYHWIVLSGRLIHDPQLGEPYALARYTMFMRARSLYVTSYATVRRLDA